MNKIFTILIIVVSEWSSEPAEARSSSMSIRGVIKIVLLLEIVASKEDLRATRTKRTFIASVLLQRILLVL